MSKSICSLFVLIFLCSCEKKPAFPVAHTYIVRGQVAQLPELGKPYTCLMVAHEAIPDFYDADGQKVGMQRMTMEFPCTDKGKLADLKIGDKLQMTVIVSKDLLQWDILAIEKLAPGTALHIAE